MNLVVKLGTHMKNADLASPIPKKKKKKNSIYKGMVVVMDFSMFLEPDQSLNQKSYQFMVHWSDQRSNQ